MSAHDSGPQHDALTAANRYRVWTESASGALIARLRGRPVKYWPALCL